MLGLIIVSFVFISVAPDSNWADSVLAFLQSITLVMALWTSGVARADSTLSLSLVALASISALALLVALVALVVLLLPRLRKRRQGQNI